jgi:phenylalanyl-tRNA synthetase alpha chain
MPHLADLVVQAKAAVAQAQDISTLDNVRVYRQRNVPRREQ